MTTSKVCIAVDRPPLSNSPVTASPSSSFVNKALRKTQTFSWTFRLCLSAGILLIALGLWHWGAVEVRGHFEQVFLLTLLGVVWLIVSLHLFPWLGLCIADDVIERRNPAALAGLFGGILGLALIYLGGSLGEGPSYWNNVFSAGLGTFGFFLLWFLSELFGRISNSIAEERDFAAGIRLCGFLLAEGLMLGRAVAGNWHSEWATVHDFLRDGWPAAALCLFGTWVEWPARPNRKSPVRPWFSFGLGPAFVYVAIASAWIYHLGRWEGMPL
jgi:uncharacterized membrane protein YjfL (UPF0719 family)